CRVLHQVGVAGPFSAGGAHQIRDGAPLVVAGEPHLGGGVLLSGDRVGGLLVFEVDELGEDLQPGVSLQDLLPQVGGRYGAVDGRVTAAVVVAPVEGKEAGGAPGQFGGHEHLVGGDSEVHQGAATGCQQRFVLGVAVALILLDRVVHRLGGIGLEFDGGHGQAVAEQDQVDGVVVLAGVVHLPHHPQ